ncbi:unnamed protein product [Oikopleura dioica]|uniref:C-type lectin domain-containing protein n=1 Tax=Oikopleura dioica TaxID=34765 RepID=E4XEB4_OIKDI|nr:unnamed protein product [Oikopleura dioica]
MKILQSTFFAASLGCPCQKIGENDFGRVIPGNSHPDSGVTKFYAQVETPIGGEQIDDFKFFIQFSENIENFKQYFAEDDFGDSTTNLVSITPGQNMISGEPYQFNFEALADSEELNFDVWFCDTQEVEDSQFKDCDEPDILDGPLFNSTTEGYTTTEAPVDFELEWTDVDGRRVAISAAPLSYKDARKACRAIGGALPWPKTQEENELINSLGSTWLGFSIDDHVSMAYENFQPITTRPFMNPNGQWSYGAMVMEKNFFCVEEKIEGCPDIFNGMELADLDGNWNVREDAKGAWMSFGDWPFKGFKPRTQVKYSCPKKIKTYKPWRRPSKKIQLTCIKMDNGQYDWVECNNKKCDAFDRCPWLNEPMRRNIDTILFPL